MEYHSHIVPGGAPWLASIGFLRDSGAIIDFAKDVAVFTSFDPCRQVQLERLPTGHVVVPLNDVVSGEPQTREISPVLKEMLKSRYD